MEEELANKKEKNNKFDDDDDVGIITLQMWSFLFFFPFPKIRFLEKKKGQLYGKQDYNGRSFCFENSKL